MFRAAAHDAFHSRQQIRERFPDAGACFNQQLFTLAHGLTDGAHHRHLLGPLLIAVAEPTGNGAIRG